MNTKRQTIWLVSMLSLMVVLSAYYLFTQDSNDGKALTDNGPKGNPTEVVDQSDKTIIDNEALNEEILAKIERDGVLASGGIFSELQTKRDLFEGSELDRLLSSVTNMGVNGTDVTAAFAELEKFEDTASKIKSLENFLMEKYEVAHIDQNDDVYNVVVSSSNMSKSEAAEIIEEVMSVMAVKPNQVSVKYVP